MTALGGEGAFKPGKRRDVDDLYAFLVKIGAKVVDPPADYPSYGDGYYAVFFLDPDGLKLEGMVFDEKAARWAREKGKVLVVIAASRAFRLGDRGANASCQF